MIDWHGEVMAMADPKRAAFNRQLNPGKYDIIGARVPDLRALAKRIIREDWKAFMAYEPQNYEEEVLRGLVIATAPVSTKERIKLTEGYMPYIDNWATCDIFCGSWKVVKDTDDAWNYFSGLIDSRAEFPMRVSVVARMNHYWDEARMQTLIDDMATHDNPGYYYRVGAAWAISEVYLRFPWMVMELFESGSLEPFTQNRAIRKICESRRVTNEDRERVKALKRLES